ncbi:hypothetical protein VF21_03830 [Pseudogymnoascus sp. 05NY08]|nr:hypothetical protein VF21_03830 [Pseudogymnoascus sp. 05NY08]
MDVKYGPTCGKIIQMRKPPGGEGIQVLIAKIWERWAIIQDAEGLETVQKNLDTRWPPEERSFQYVLGTEYMVISLQDIKAEVQISLSPDLIYHRPYDPEDSDIHSRSAMKKHFSKDGVFYGIKLVQESEFFGNTDCSWTDGEIGIAMRIEIAAVNITVLEN